MTETLGPAATYIDAISATRDAIGVFGRVCDAEYMATVQGRAYLGSTANVSVQIGQVLAVVIANPVGSGVNLHLTGRRFSTGQSNTDAPTEYLAFADPTAVLATPGIIQNRTIGPSSAATLRYTAGPSAGIVMGGTAASGESIRVGGGATERYVLVVIPPGHQVGYTVTGAGNNLTQAIRASVTLEWFEEPVQP